MTLSPDRIDAVLSNPAVTDLLEMRSPDGDGDVSCAERDTCVAFQLKTSAEFAEVVIEDALMSMPD